MSKSLADRLEWLKEHYPHFTVESRFLPYLECAEQNTPLGEEETEEDFWVPVSDVQDLKDMTPITHELWRPTDEETWQSAEKDAKDGVTFAFFWQENALCWER